MELLPYSPFCPLLMAIRFSSSSYSSWLSAFQTREDIGSEDLGRWSSQFLAYRRSLHLIGDLKLWFVGWSMEFQATLYLRRVIARYLSWRCSQQHLRCAQPRHRSYSKFHVQLLYHSKHHHLRLGQWSYAFERRTECAWPGRHHSQSLNRPLPRAPPIWTHGQRSMSL